MIPSPITGAAMASRTIPASRAAGKPTANRLSCGAERASIAHHDLDQHDREGDRKRDREAGGEQDAAEQDEAVDAVRRDPGRAGRQRAIAFDDRRGEREMAADREEQEGGKDRQELADHRIGLAVLPDRSRRRSRGPSHCRSPRRRAGRQEKPIWTAKPSASPAITSPATSSEAGHRGEPLGRQLEGRGGERRDAERQRDDQAQLHRHEAGAEDRRGEEGGAGADHRHQPQPELSLRPRRSPPGSSHDLGDSGENVLGEIDQQRR